MTPHIVSIVGMSRSGSTLVDRVLGQSANAVSLGEVHHIWLRGVVENQLCGCGVSFSDCPFWSEVMERLTRRVPLTRELLRSQQAVVRNKTIPLSYAPAVASSVWRSRLREYAAAMNALYDEVAAASGAEFVIDSSKRVSHGAVLRHIARDRLHFVHLSRDSRAVAFSLARFRTKSDSGKSDREMTRLSALDAARGWNRSNGLAEVVTRTGSTRTFVRYEDFVSEPRALVDSLQRLGLEPPVCTGGSVYLSAAHTVSGNPMRMQVGNTELRLDEEWRTAMPVGQRRLVTALTGPLLMRYGYLGLA